MNGRLPFVVVFHLILISCTYPSSWKHALVQPVPKKDDDCNLSSYSYRSIVLISAIAKVFETLLNSHFIKLLESNILLSDQYGFRKAKSIGIFFPILLIPGHPLLGTLGNHLLSPLISLKHLTVSARSLC